MAKVTSKGQVTLPKAVRDQLGLHPGTEVEFEVRGDFAIVHRRAPQEAIDQWFGYLKDKTPYAGTDDLMRELRDR